MDMTKEGALIARQDAARALEGARARKVLAWRVGREEYGVAIHAVQEIRSYERPTRLPGAPAHVLGVMNLRGLIVPVVDLRLRLGGCAVAYDATTVVIVLASRQRITGVVVDGVSDVLQLDASAILPPPRAGDEASPGFVTGLATVDERMLMLVDMDRLLR